MHWQCYFIIWSWFDSHLQGHFFPSCCVVFDIHHLTLTNFTRFLALLVLEAIALNHVCCMLYFSQSSSLLLCHSILTTSNYKLRFIFCASNPFSLWQCGTMLNQLLPSLPVGLLGTIDPGSLHSYSYLHSLGNGNGTHSSLLSTNIQPTRVWMFVNHQVMAPTNQAAFQICFEIPVPVRTEQSLW